MLETCKRLHFSMPASRRASSKEWSCSRCVPTPLVKNSSFGMDWFNVLFSFAIRNASLRSGNLIPVFSGLPPERRILHSSTSGCFLRHLCFSTAASPSLSTAHTGTLTASDATGHRVISRVQPFVIIGVYDFFHRSADKRINRDPHGGNGSLEGPGNGTADQNIDSLVSELGRAVGWIGRSGPDHRAFLPGCSVCLEDQQLVCCVEDRGYFIFKYRQGDLHSQTSDTELFLSLIHISEPTRPF